jgi:hypothetical protein
MVEIAEAYASGQIKKVDMKPLKKKLMLECGAPGRKTTRKKPAAALGAMAAASPRPRLAAGKKRQRLEVEKKPASAQLEVEEKPASVQLEEAKEARQVKRKPAIAQLEEKPASAQLEEEKKPASAQLEPEQEEEEEEEEPEQDELSAQQEGEPEQGEEDTGRMHFLNLTQLLREPGLPSQVDPSIDKVQWTSHSRYNVHACICPGVFCL